MMQGCDPIVSDMQKLLVHRLLYQLSHIEEIRIVSQPDQWYLDYTTLHLRHYGGHYTKNIFIELDFRRKWIILQSTVSLADTLLTGLYTSW